MNPLRKYPISKYNNAWYVQKFNSKNATDTRDIYRNIFLPDDEEEEPEDDVIGALLKKISSNSSDESSKPVVGGMRIVVNKNVIHKLAEQIQNAYTDDSQDVFGRPIRSTLKNKRSENFEVITKCTTRFCDVGGYENIKQELNQCIDILANYSKYAPYNVRVPKGLILEGPPGNGKTLLAKALAGEAQSNFIAVSGAEFQDKYVGVGSGRVRELFKLAKENVPCVIFIDEIDALGRKRSGDGETSGSERDNTLNELLIALDGFKNTTGVFVVGATNRADLLDSALLRPGRIDKRIYIGNPDTATRRAILNIHSRGKPCDSSVVFEDVVELTNGLSGAQIENLLNEAMLLSLRRDDTAYTSDDVDTVLNKMMVGWQPSEHQFTPEMIDQIAIHELGHAIMGLLAKHHSKMTKAIINLSSPKSPAYTVFEGSTMNIMTREALFEHLMILLSGRIAEEIFYEVSVSTGAINDFEEALKLAERMVCYYGMGKNLIYPSTSEKYKEMIDNDVSAILNDAYGYAEFVLRNSRDLIAEGAEILKRDRVVHAETLIELMNRKYRSVLSLKI
jgi:cell division protease FtsH